MGDPKPMLPATPLAAGNAAYIEEQYERYLADPNSVTAPWREYFASLGGQGDRAHGPIVAELAQRGATSASRTGATTATAPADRDNASAKQAAVSRLIQTYMNRGHLVADIDPLGLMVRPRPRVLELEYFGLTEADLDPEFYTGSRNDAIKPRLKLRDIFAQLRHIYCGTIGAEFAHVSDSTERLWLQDRFQTGRMREHPAPDARRNILWQLTTAEGLERYLATKYPAQKRFSLEGGDSLIPLLDDLIQRGGHARRGHRDRHGASRPPQRAGQRARQVAADLFSEFEGQYDLKELKGSGDVKYHKGFSSDLRTPAATCTWRWRSTRRISRSSTPSSKARCARARSAARDARGDKVMAVLMHGDAAFAGAGRRDGNAADVAGARLLHRRHRAHHHQQPGRLHDQRSARRALDAVLQRRRQDDRGADLPREWRRSRGGRVRRRASRSTTG